MLSFCYHLENSFKTRRTRRHHMDTLKMSLKLARKIRRNCYHYVIIVIDNIFYDGCIRWFLFLSFFSSQKMTFFVAKKHETIMLSFFHHKSLIKICYFFISLCTKVKKILEKWTRKYVQKWIPRYLFGKKRAALGNLRNFFGAMLERPYMQW